MQAHLAARIIITIPKALFPVILIRKCSVGANHSTSSSLNPLKCRLSQIVTNVQPKIKFKSQMILKSIFQESFFIPPSLKMFPCSDKISLEPSGRPSTALRLAGERNSEKVHCNLPGPTTDRGVCVCVCVCVCDGSGDEKRCHGHFLQEVNLSSKQE